MGFYKLTLLTSAFSHLMKIIEKTENIAEIYGKRICDVESKSFKLSDSIPYVSKRVDTMKKIELHKHSFSQAFSLNKILEFLLKEDIGDMSIGGFSLLINDGILKETCEKLLGKKIADKRFVLKFINNTTSGKEDKTRQQLTDIMRLQIDKFDFKIASLDLIGVYAYQDYVKDKQLNLLTELQKDKKLLKEIADEYFKEFIVIQGVQKKIRAIKYYEMGNKNMPILKDITVF